MMVTTGFVVAYSEWAYIIYTLNKNNMINRMGDTDGE